MENGHKDELTPSATPHEDEGPPPGWERIKQTDDDDDGPPPGWDRKNIEDESAPDGTHPYNGESPSRFEDEHKAVADQGSNGHVGDEERREFEESSVNNNNIRPRHSDMAQMVCGSCRGLLSYRRGARFVKCGSCCTVNYVLQEFEVGQVKCGNCGLLLMYPYGAPSVRCSSCRFVTEIGAQNIRPPWSVLQGRPGPPSSVVQ